MVQLGSADDAPVSLFCCCRCHLTQIILASDKKLPFRVSVDQHADGRMEEEIGEDRLIDAPIEFAESLTPAGSLTCDCCRRAV